MLTALQIITVVWGGRSSLCGSSLEVTAKEAVFLGLRSWVTLPSSHEDKLRTMKTLRELSCSSLLFKICVCIFIKPSTMGYSVRKNIMIPREANSPCRHQFSPASTMGSKPWHWHIQVLHYLSMLSHLEWRYSNINSQTTPKCVWVFLVFVLRMYYFP